MKKCFRGQFARFIAAAVVFLCSVPSSQPVSSKTGALSLKPREYSLDRMGTVFRIVLYDSDDARALGAAMAAFERIEELENILSDYRQDSEIVRLCREGSSGPQGVSPELFYVLEQSLRFSRLTRGAFDVTVGPVVQLWREARKTGRVPDPAALARAKALVGYNNVVLNPDAGTVWLKLPNMKIDFGAIGKGYAADEAVTLLRSRGIRSCMVQAGGELMLGAAPPGKAGWKIAVRDTDGGSHGEPHFVILHDVAIATSGDAFQFVEIDGRRYSHIVNPETGLGLIGAESATVIAPKGIMADALATAFSVMPVERGIKLADSIEGVSAAIVRRSEGTLTRSLSTRFPKAVPDVPASRESITASGQRSGAK